MSSCNADGTASAIETDASKAAVQWYLDLFKNGLAHDRRADLGAGWCGEALGTKKVAMTFEGGWLDPAMTGTYPGRQVRLGGDAGRFVRQAR